MPPMIAEMEGKRTNVEIARPPGGEKAGFEPVRVGVHAWSGDQMCGDDAARRLGASGEGGVCFREGG